MKIITKLDKMNQTDLITAIIEKRMLERYNDSLACESVVEYFERIDSTCIIPLMRSSGRKSTTERLGPSGGTVRAAISPPLGNRGGTIHGETVREENCPHVMGGYDGGTELGLEGDWEEAMFNHFVQQAEAAKESAADKDNDGKFFEIDGHTFEMLPKSAAGGVFYKWVFEREGVKYYVHNNASGNIQPVRLCFKTEGIIARDIVQKYNETVKVLENIGFHVTSEKFSRIDMQVMTHEPMDTYAAAFHDGRIVCPAQKKSVHY
ncbi:MAG: hypothetical protein ACRCUY_09180, partial [Thermoguttaceae bacterium]